jgi:hypothetical protein
VTNAREQKRIESYLKYEGSTKSMMMGKPVSGIKELFAWDPQPEQDVMPNVYKSICLVQAVKVQAQA